MDFFQIFGIHFGPYGVLPFKFLHVLQINQGLVAHTRSWTGVPPPKKKIIAKT